MLISIIIPTYNRGHLISQAIESLLNQSFTHWELIIVDDGSKDNTDGVVRTFDDPRIRYFRMDDNRGAPFCRNYGLKQSKGEYVGFLDSDDSFHPDKLLKHWQLFSSDSYDCTVSECERHNHTQKKITRIRNLEPKENLIIEFINKSVAWKMMCPIWRKKFLIDNEVWFEENLRNSQDYQFNCYAILNRPKVGYIHESLAIINDHDSNVDPYKIRKSRSLNSLKSHLISRFLVLQYAKKRKISSGELEQIRVHMRRHKLSCFYAALKISFFDCLKLMVFSLSSRSVRKNP